MSEENKYLFGLSPHDIEQLLGVFRKEEAIEEVVLYGSRARNTFERGSDVDLAIKGKGVDSMLIALLKHTLEEETSIPYFFDVTDYQTVSNDEFRKNIDRQGKPIYKKGYRLTKEGDLVPEEWEETTLGNVAEKIAMGPFGSNIKVETFVDNGISVISGMHLTGIKLEDKDYNFISEEHAKNLKSANVYPGDIIFTHAGNIGQVAFIPTNSKYKRYVLSQRQFYLRAKTDVLYPAYLIPNATRIMYYKGI